MTHSNLLKSVVSQILVRESSYKLHVRPPEMWHSSELILRTISRYAKAISKWEEDGESTSSMFLYGLLYATFLPILAVTALVDFGVLLVAKMIIPTASVLLMLLVGLPTVAVVGWLFSTYKFACSVVSQFFLGDALIVSDVRLACKKNALSRTRRNSHALPMLGKLRDDLAKLADYEGYDAAAYGESAAMHY